MIFEVHGGMNPGPRLNSRSRWYTLSLDFVQRFAPQLLCPPDCSHNPCQPPVIWVLVVDPRGRGRPKISHDEARVIIADAIHALQRRGEPITQPRVREQAGWPSSNAKLSAWAKRLGYPHWHALVEDLKLRCQLVKQPLLRFQHSVQACEVSLYFASTS
jgi:hypothetical protein